MDSALLFRKMPRMNRRILLLIVLFYSIIMNGQFGPDFEILADKAFLKLYQNSDECINYTQGILVSNQDEDHITE